MLNGETKTATNATTKTAIIVWGIATVAILGVAAIGTLKIAYSGNLFVSDAIWSIPDKILSNSTNQTLFITDINADKETVKISQIKITAIATKNADPQLLTKITNLKLYIATNDPPETWQEIASTSKLTLQNQKNPIGWATFDTSLNIEPNPYVELKLALKGDTAFDTLTGSISFQIAGNNDIKARGFNSKRIITPKIGFKKGNWLKIVATPPNCDINCQKDSPSGWLDFYFEPERKFTKIEANFNWVKLPKMMNVGIYSAVIYTGFEYPYTTLYSGPQIILENGQMTRKVVFSVWDAWDNLTNTAIGTAKISSPWCTRFEGEGSGVSCFLPDNNWWQENKEYKITVEKSGWAGDMNMWSANIEDLRTHEKKLIGSIIVPNVKSYNGFGSLERGSGGFWEYFSGTPEATQCLTAEYSKIIRTQPIADGKWLPKKATYKNTNCIAARRYVAPNGTVIEEVGEGVIRPTREPKDGVLWDLPNDRELPTATNNLIK